VIQRKSRLGFAHILVAIFIAALLASPFFVVAFNHKHEFIPFPLWSEAGAVSASFLVALAYAWHRCSTAQLSYWRGLLVVAGSMSGGTFGFSMVFAFPALLFTVIASIFFSLSGDILRLAGVPPTKFQVLVSRFYKHRFHQ